MDSIGMDGKDVRLDLSMDAFLSVYHKGDDLTLDLSRPLNLDQAELLIPTGPGGWRKVSAILLCLLREAKESRQEAYEIRKEAYKIKHEAENKANEIRLEANKKAAEIRQEAEIKLKETNTEANTIRVEANNKANEVRDEANKKANEIKEEAEQKVKEAKIEADLKSSAIRAEAEKKCGDLRIESNHKHRDHEIKLGKLEAQIDSHQQYFKDCYRIFEDNDIKINRLQSDLDDFSKELDEHGDAIHNVIDYVDKKCNVITEKIETSVKNSQLSFSHMKDQFHKLMMLFSALPILILFCITFWIMFTMPNKIHAETDPQFAKVAVELDALSGYITTVTFNLDSFQSVMKSEIDMINTGTENEFNNVKDETFSLAANIETKISNFVKNVEKRFQLVVSGVDKQLESLRADVGEKFSSVQTEMEQVQGELNDQLVEASHKMEEFMTPKIWLSKTVSKENKILHLEGASLGLYKEEGKVNDKPTYFQVNGKYKLYSNVSGWVISHRNGQQMEEIFLQVNSKLPQVATDRWKYPTHKVAIVHTVPCCRTITIKHPYTGKQEMYVLTETVQNGRGHYQSPQGGVLYFHDNNSWLATEVSQIQEKGQGLVTGWVTNVAQTSCPGEAAKVAKWTTMDPEATGEVTVECK